MSDGDSREHIFSQFLDDIGYQSEWRSEKAVEWPDDERNERCANALENLATWVREHPTDSAVVRIIAAQNALYSDPDGGASFEPSVANRLAKYGFHHSEPEPPAAFLNELAAEIEEHVKEQAEGSARENRRQESVVRRAVAKAGFQLRKSRARTLHGDDHGGYRILEPLHNVISAGERFDLSLEDVVSWLKEHGHEAPSLK